MTAALARFFSRIINVLPVRLSCWVTRTGPTGSTETQRLSGLSLLAALASGLAPALQASKAQPVAALKDSHGPSRSRLRQAFVIAQVALSVALVVGAGLFARALARAGAVDPGFNHRGVELTSIDISMAGYTDATGPAFWRSLVEGVRALPGVQGATVARVVPGGFEGIGLGLGVPGGHSSGDDFEPDGNIIEPGYQCNTEDRDALILRGPRS